MSAQTIPVMLHHMPNGSIKVYVEPSALVRAINPRYRKQPSEITDRAKRYRANADGNRPQGKRICFACGHRGRLDVHHLTGNEAHGNPSDLAWACRSCNVRIGNVMRRAGIGKQTRQYNPASEGAHSLGAWMNAIASMRGFGGTMTVSDAVAMVRATSPSLRSKYAEEIWAIRRARGTDSVVPF